MDTAFISAFSALAGSIVGGLTSGVTTWLGHRSQARAGHRLHNVTQREALYRDFVMAASEAYGSAVVNSEPKLSDIVVLYSMISRMRIMSDPSVITCAERTVDRIMDAYFMPKKTFSEVRDMIRSGENIDPLKEFSQTAREELRAL